MMLGRLKELCRENTMFLTVVPGLIFLHWGWLKLQDNPAFVPPDKKKEGFPFPRFLKKLGAKIQGGSET